MYFNLYTVRSVYKIIIYLNKYGALMDGLSYKGVLIKAKKVHHCETNSFFGMLEI